MQTSLFGREVVQQDDDSAIQKKPAGRVKYVPWVEKYRPSTMEEVASQEDVVAVLKKALAGADFPNMLFYGPPGTGKTSTILAVSKQLFGRTTFRERVMELNASDERGIKVVREKVKQFAQVTVSEKTSDGRPCPPFKIIILDEADSMTQPAQAALRRTMEKWTHSTRFCLICNYVSRIIEPITSRCAKFRFKPLPRPLIQARLKHIAEAEGVQLGGGCGEGDNSNEGEVMTSLIDASEGDLRKAITYLQCSYRLGGSRPVSKEIVEDIAGYVEQTSIVKLVTTCRSGSFDAIQASVKDLLLNGFAAAKVLSQVHDYVMTSDELFHDRQKCVIFEKLAAVDRCLMDGADEYLQLMGLCTTIMDASSM